MAPPVSLKTSTSAGTVFLPIQSRRGSQANLATTDEVRSDPLDAPQPSMSCFDRGRCITGWNLLPFAQVYSARHAKQASVHNADRRESVWLLRNLSRQVQEGYGRKSGTKAEAFRSILI
jgi:hypothetical protein